MSNNISRPLSLRAPERRLKYASSLALGLSIAMAASPASAQDSVEEVELDVLRIEDRAADVNPYTQDGAPYKAKVSGDTRRVKPLSETPATISVLTETQLEEQGATSLRDVLDNQPGITVGTGENGNAFGDRYIIRGHEARSDVFVDGLRDPGMTTRETFAVEQVEITKGPSSSFAGRGATGGAINSITKQASTDYDFNRVDVGVGTDGYFRGSLDSNFVVNEDAAVRANLLYGIEDVPGRDFSDRERIGAAISGRYTPSDKLDILLDYYHLTAEDTPDLGGYLPAPTGTGPDDIVRYEPWHDVPNYAQGEDFQNSEINTLTGRVNFEISNSIRLSNATRFGKTENEYVLTGLRGGAVDPETDTFGAVTLSTHQGTQDVEYFVNQSNLFADFDTATMKHNLVAGIEYSNQNVVNGTFDVTNTAATNCITTGRRGETASYCITDENRNVIVDDIHNFLDREITAGETDSDWTVKTTSVYVMDTIELHPQLSVHGGIRADYVDYSNVVTRQGTTTDYAYSDTLWNGHAGIGVKPIDETYIYLNWGTATNINGGESDLGSSCGYGGICVDEGTSAEDGAPESSTSLELGVKADLFDDRFLITAALFQLNKSDVYESAGDSYSAGGSLNTGENEVRGLEVGLVGNLSNKLSGQVGLTVMESEVTASTDPAIIGRRLSNFSNTQASGQLRYQFSEAVAIGGTATYKGEMYTGQPDTAAGFSDTFDIYTYEIPAYWTFDAFASYQINSNFGLRLNATNLTNEDYYLAGYRSGHFLYKGDERRATATLTGRF